MRKPAAVSFRHPPDVVVWGLGTGRHIRRRLLRARVGVLAVDLPPDGGPEVRERLSLRPALVSALERGQLEVLCGTSAELAAAFAACSGADVHVHRPALDAAPPCHARLARTLLRLAEERTLSRRFSGRMRANLRENLDAIAGAAPLTAWSGAWRDGAVTVVAAGPSLDRARPLLPTLAQRSLVVSVDTALRALAQAEVQVDVAATVDPHPESAAHIRRVPTTPVLAFQPYASPQVVAAFPRKVVAAPAGDRFWHRIGPRLGIPLLPTAGTVLLYALQIAELLDPREVWVVGADLSFPGTTTHATFCAHTRPVDDAVVFTRGTGGQKVPTTTTLRRFQDAVEAFLARSRRVYRFLDGGGARVAGSQPVTASALAARARAFAPRAPSPADLPVPARRSADRKQVRLELGRVLAEFDTACPPANDLG